MPLLCESVGLAEEMDAGKVGVADRVKVQLMCHVNIQACLTTCCSFVAAGRILC